MRIAILGGGPGGYSAAFEAARLGAEVTLIERERLGGTCLNWGCIPTKTILRSAHIVSDTKRAAEFGLSSGVASVDVDALRTRKEGVVDTLVGQLESSAKRLKVRMVYGEGRMIGAKEIEVDLAEGGTEVVEADSVILATGSIVFKLPNIDHDMPGVWTSDDAVSLTEIPGEILIIGGGVIGLEFACAYAAFGSKVVVVELMDQVLPGNDKRVAKTMQAELEKMGIEFHIGDAVESVERVGERMRSTLKSGGTIESDIVMSAVGRRPNSQGFGYEEIGLEFDRAAIKADDYFRTNLPGVYAIGDLIGGMMLAHVAEEEGVLSARNAVAELKAAEAGGEPHLETPRLHVPSPRRSTPSRVWACWARAATRPRSAGSTPSRPSRSSAATARRSARARRRASCSSSPRRARARSSAARSWALRRWRSSRRSRSRSAGASR